MASDLTNPEIPNDVRLDGIAYGEYSLSDLTNPENRYDVNVDSFVSPLDVL
jgi:hypothetical protein